MGPSTLGASKAVVGAVVVVEPAVTDTVVDDVGVALSQDSVLSHSGSLTASGAAKEGTTGGGSVMLSS